MAHPGRLFAEPGFPVTPMLSHILAPAVDATDFRPSRFLTQSSSHQGRRGPSSSPLLAMAPAFFCRSSLILRTSLIGVAS